ncbi:pilus assembly protein TadG-related protein [Tianweitania sediminis]|uniref:Putative Flp pilus-assembly TadG-like N-terminal domain-containing protein n=1 Tax=Tianweitania sediminis TaxID=1502156 RepID=A0A8J7UIB1_9HYPH|nr:pilus assembly protein TadG-related protein [Tianweitania sediminis]MBP0437610.1 hypothetical protein [Tianweitania sediminis]
MIDFLKSKSGNIALSAAVMLPALVGGVGMAIDYSRLTDARSVLQQSADAAVLAAAKMPHNDAQRRQVFEQVLRTNSGGDLRISKLDLAIRDTLNEVELTGTATADVDLIFLHQMGQHAVTVKASAYQATKNIAVSLVLDNTGSMGQAGIDALKKASHALVSAVESSAGDRTDIHMSLVPFVTAVNIKADGFDESWIDKDGKSLYNGWTFLNPALREARRNGERLAALPDNYADEINGVDQACNNQGEGQPAIEKREACQKRADAKVYPHASKLFALSGTTWKGCVEARPSPYNLSVDAPSAAKPDTLFVPYFAPDEPGVSTSAGGNDANTFNNSWLNDAITGADSLVQRSTLKYVRPDVKTIQEAKGVTRGPNRSCPTPVTPLTTDLSKIRAGIDAMQFWNGSGTNIPEGLAWGWRMLTPNAPFPQAEALQFGDVTKYIVLMTDGRNVAYGGKNTINKSDYSSYGFLASERIGGTTDQGKAETKQNEWTLQLCEAVKKTGIQIFTVVYNEKDQGVQNMFKKCATQPTNFFMADNTTALQAVFARIGANMSVLRLTQ